MMGEDIIITHLMPTDDDVLDLQTLHCRKNINIHSVGEEASDMGGGGDALVLGACGGA